MFDDCDSFFDLIPDIDSDGDHDLVDFLIFDSLLDEEEGPEFDGDGDDWDRDVDGDDDGDDDGDW